MAAASYHPNVLAALGTARIQFTEIETERTSTIIEKINTETPQYTRYVHLLDGLASLSVSRPDGQVVAIALDKSGQVITLTIALNEDVPAELIAYVTDLITQLKAYSNLAMGDDAGRTAAKLVMMKKTYIYCDKKLYQRFTKRKWLIQLEKAFATRGTGLGAGAEVCLELLSSLMRIRETYDVIHEWQKIKTAQPKKFEKMTPSKQVNDADWEKLILEMDGAIPDVKKLLADKASCDAWAETLKGEVFTKPGIPVPLHHAIEKLTSHHRFALQLLQFATNAAGRDDLACMINVVGKPAVAGGVPVVFPSIPDVEKIITPWLLQGVVLADEMTLIQAGVKKEFTPLVLGPAATAPFTASVHCECALIADFNTQPHPDLEPFRYIGVSKLSCAACHLWVRAFNATHHYQYHTRGTHGKWYPKWAMPTSLQTPEMLASMRDEVENAYKAHSQSKNTRGIVLSDSTEAKGSLSDATVTGPQSMHRLTLTRPDRTARVNGGVAMPLPTKTSTPVWD